MAGIVHRACKLMSAYSVGLESVPNCVWQKVRYFSAHFLCGFFLVAISPSLLALDPSRHITQYGHTAWRIGDGALAHRPEALTQTTDGYIWIGTEAGIFRFDGVQFTPWPYAGSEPNLNLFINALRGTSDGSLWIGTQNGLTRLKDGKLTSYPASSPGEVGDIMEDHTGTVWVTRFRVDNDSGPLCRVAGAKLQCFGLADGVESTYLNTLIEDHAGGIWLGSPNFCRWTPGSCIAFFSKELFKKQHEEGVHSLAVGSDGAVWAGFDIDGHKMGLQRFSEDHWAAYLAPGFDSSQITAGYLLTDRNGALWVGTKEGIYRIYRGTVEHFGNSDGLSSDSVVGLNEDREGNIWVTTKDGIDLFKDLPVANFSAREGMVGGAGRSVVAAPDGSIWGAADSGLNVIRDHRASQIQPLPGPDKLPTFGSFKDHTGRLWFGVGHYLTFYENGQFQKINNPDGSDLLPPRGRIAAFTETKDHEIWALAAYTYPVRLLGIRNNAVVEHIPINGLEATTSLVADPNGGIWLGQYADKFARYRDGRIEMISLASGKEETRIHSMFSDTGDSVWLATGKGLFHWEKGNLKKLDARNGLPCIDIISIMRDNQGAFWLNSSCGLFKITASEMSRWRERPDINVAFTMLDVLDGMHPELGLFQSHVAKATDGKLWYVNEDGLSAVDPNNLYENKTPPPVHIEGVIADRVSYRLQDGLRLPALTRDLEIDYTALSFVSPQRVRFRYKLENYDRDWHEAGTRRQAFFTELRPGNYQFHVIACNNSGLWNDVGATIYFAIKPAYYQTVWFRLLCVVVAMGILWVLYFFRLKQVTAQIQGRLGARLEERERIARELHDTLLQGFQGLMLRFQAVMKTLPAHEPAHQMMEKVLDQADEVLLEGRQSVRDLREQGTSGVELSEVLALCGEELAQGHATLFSLAVIGAPRALGPIIFNEAYSIAREALINALQHSHATKIEVEMTYSDSGVCIRIRDDGAGIDAEILTKGRVGHWGLSGMRERTQKIGAQLNIWSRSGAGTEIELTIPARVAYPRSGERTLWERIRSAVTRSEEASL
jgi:ligand-binding sensor domain-containing protein